MHAWLSPFLVFVVHMLFTLPDLACQSPGMYAFASHAH